MAPSKKHTRLSHPPDSIDDEDKRNQPRKDIFAEHSHVLHQRAQVEDRHQDGEERAPHAGPKVEGHELEVL